MTDPLPAVRLAHVALAVRDLGESERAFEKALTLFSSGRETVAKDGVRISFLPVGAAEIELLEPLDTMGALARFVASRRGGVHHLALEVDDLRVAVARARGAGLVVMDEEPRRGARGSSIVFLNPRSTCGILVELVESAD